jgi:protocatechuate 3,4-dioxygenase, alpha subunit
VSPHYPGNFDLYARQTPAQTLGPFFRQGLVRTRSVFASEGLCGDERDVFHQYVASESTPGERLRIEGVVYDGLQQPIPDALVELWQADAAGRYAHPLQQPLATVGAGATPAAAQGSTEAFVGFGRAPTDDAGRYFFETIKPGAVPGLGGCVQAPHINLVLGARGMSRLAFTRLYFAEDPEIAVDPVLVRVPVERRRTLIAARRAPGSLSVDRSAGDQKAARSGPASVYVFDIHLQGEQETVFFDF